MHSDPGTLDAVNAFDTLRDDVLGDLARQYLRHASQPLEQRRTMLLLVEVREPDPVGHVPLEVPPGVLGAWRPAWWYLAGSL